MSGLPLKRFFNKSGIPYREMGLSKKLPDMSEDEQFALLATDGMLVKRPLLIGDDFVLTGFKEAEWAEKLNIDTTYSKKAIASDMSDYQEEFNQEQCR